MGLFSSKKHNPQIVKEFEALMVKGASESENEFLDSLNKITTAIEYDDSYSTNDKLKIYELISQISNCAASQRTKYAAQLKKKLS